MISLVHTPRNEPKVKCRRLGDCETIACSMAWICSGSLNSRWLHASNFTERYRSEVGKKRGERTASLSEEISKLRRRSKRGNRRPPPHMSYIIFQLFKSIRFEGDHFNSLIRIA